MAYGIILNSVVIPSYWDITKTLTARFFYAILYSGKEGGYFGHPLTILRRKKG
jgi:hypothetical protein